MVGTVDPSPTYQHALGVEVAGGDGLLAPETCHLHLLHAAQNSNVVVANPVRQGD